jgi:hypothetical protein
VEDDDEAVAALIEAGAHVAIVEATREAIRAGHSDALWEACRALENLAAESTARTPLVQADAHVAVVEAIREAIRAGRPDVMLSACAVVVNLSCSAAEQAALIFQAGALVALVEAIREAIRVRHADALMVACHALTNLADGDSSRAMAQVRPARTWPSSRRPARRSAPVKRKPWSTPAAHSPTSQ